MDLYLVAIRGGWFGVGFDKFHERKVLPHVREHVEFVGGEEIFFRDRTIKLKGDLIRIGRSPDTNEIPLDTTDISRQHCTITQAAGKWTINDLGSKNGTSVNGERVTAPRELKDGDELVLGVTTILSVMIR